MPRSVTSAVLLTGLVAMLAGCGEPEPDAGDAGETSAAPSDGGGPDSAPAEAGSGHDGDGSGERSDGEGDGGGETDAAEPGDARSGEGDAPSGEGDATGGEVPEQLGDERPAEVVVPEGYEGEEPRPLVVLLHGIGGNASAQDTLFRFSQRVTERGFVLLLPNGTTNPQEQRFWHASSVCCDFYGSGVDDLGYLRGLVEEAQAKLAIDPDRIAFVGHSNGAFMALRMACDAADLVDAAVSLAGADPLSLEGGERASEPGAPPSCSPSEPVSILHAHGTADETVAYDGGSFASFGGGAYPGAEETVARWRTRNGCPDDGTEGEARDFDDAAEGAETTPTRWTGCDDDRRVALWRMEGSAHIPQLTDAWREAVLDFALQP